MSCNVISLPHSVHYTSVWLKHLSDSINNIRSFASFDSIKAAFEEGAVSGEELKETLTTFLNRLLKKVRKREDLSNIRS